MDWYAAVAIPILLGQRERVGGTAMAGMTGTIEALLAATGAFVLGHFILSSLPVRSAIIGAVGEGPFRAIYSILAGLCLFWTILAFGDAPFHEVWTPPQGMRHLTFLLVLIGVFFLVIGVTTKSPTAVGGDKMAGDPHPLAGILTVTRHPFLIGVICWAVGHLLANGDLASIILFGGILILAVGGIAHIDMRRRHSLGSAWGPIALSTSVVPFLAILQKRARLDWRGIGLPRVVLALAIYAALAYGHQWFAGISLVG